MNTAITVSQGRHFDAIIIGTGQAGLPLAARFAGGGKTVAIIERNKFGFMFGEVDLGRRRLRVPRPRRLIPKYRQYHRPIVLLQRFCSDHTRRLDSLGILTTRNRRRNMKILMVLTSSRMS
jgi:hypothetical protein